MAALRTPSQGGFSGIRLILTIILVQYVTKYVYRISYVVCRILNGELCHLLLIIYYCPRLREDDNIISLWPLYSLWLKKQC